MVTTIPVLWGDEDGFGHVNNLAYLRWCETSRVEYLRRVSLWKGLSDDGSEPILASIRCDYKAQVNYPDTVQIGTRVSRIGNASIKMEHLVVSLNLGRVVALVDSTLVAFDYGRGKPVTVSAQTRLTIRALEGGRLEETEVSAAKG